MHPNSILTCKYKYHTIGLEGILIWYLFGLLSIGIDMIAIQIGKNHISCLWGIFAFRHNGDQLRNPFNALATIVPWYSRGFRESLIGSTMTTRDVSLPAGCATDRGSVCRPRRWLNGHVFRLCTQSASQGTATEFCRGTFQGNPVRVPLKPLLHRANMVLRGLRGGLKWALNTQARTSLSGSWDKSSFLYILYAHYGRNKIRIFKLLNS